MGKAVLGCSPVSSDSSVYIFLVSTVIYGRICLVVVIHYYKALDISIYGVVEGDILTVPVRGN